MSFSIKPEERERETDTMGGPPSAGADYPLTYHLGRQTAPSALDAPRQHHSNSAPASVNGAMDAPEQDDPGTVSASANEAFSSGRQATSSAMDAPEQDHPGPTSIPANESSKDKHTTTRPVLRERTQEAMHQLNLAAVHKKGGANSAYERFHDVCRKHDELAFRFTSEQMRLTDAKMRFDAVRRWRRTGQSPVPSRMARWELELQYAAEKHRKRVTPEELLRDRARRLGQLATRVEAKRRQVETARRELQGKGGGQTAGSESEHEQAASDSDGPQTTEYHADRSD